MSIVEDINSIRSGAVRAVAFDIGGVLIQINRTWEDALFDGGIRNGVHGGLAQAPNFEAFQRGDIRVEEYVEGLKEFLHLESNQEALRIHNLIIKDPYPGTFELIQELNDLGIATACLSNTNAPHWIEMTESGRFPNIEALKHHAVSQEMNLQKPDPAIFRAFEDATGLSPREIVFFDDLEDNVEAAREVGWRAFWVDHTGDTAEQMELILIAERVLPPP